MFRLPVFSHTVADVEPPKSLDEELALLMEYNPPGLPIDNRLPELDVPFIFYDKHLGAQFLLKKVELSPLPTQLAAVADRAVQSIKDRSTPLPSISQDNGLPFSELRFPRDVEEVKNVGDLMHRFAMTNAYYFSTLASTYLLHPSAAGWHRAFYFGPLGDGTTMSSTVSMSHGLQLHALDGRSPMPPPIVNAVDDPVRELMRQVKTRHPKLVFWAFFAPTDETTRLFKEINAVKTFNHEQCKTGGYKVPPLSSVLHLDAPIMPWGTSIPSPSTPTKANDSHNNVTMSAKNPTSSNKGHTDRKKGNKDGITDSGVTDVKAKITLPNVIVPGRAVKRPLSDLFVLRAWARSVENDTTFIVFNCGNFERIGFRHRATQTLFLSDLINVTNCKDPAYGKIQAGLFLSIIQDAIDRTNLERQGESKPSKKRKRDSVPDTAPSEKRYRTRASALKEMVEAQKRHDNFETVRKHTKARGLALLELRYGVYNSPSPASFVRTKTKQQKNYSPAEYFSLLLTSKIASGATGVVHGARLELVIDGQTRSLDAVVKLAFEPDQIARMRHEYSIYNHLAANGIEEGIPFIFGLFEDVETDAIALIMSNVGECIRHRMPPRGKSGTTSDVRISDPAKAAYLRLLSNIHGAGVRHRDIRPENLMLISEDRVAIIDFDMAEMNPSEGAKRREMRHLADLLNGDYVPPNEFSSLATTPEGEAADITHEGVEDRGSLEDKPDVIGEVVHGETVDSGVHEGIRSEKEERHEAEPEEGKTGKTGKTPVADD